jgi:hypothetical protein
LRGFSTPHTKRIHFNLFSQVVHYPQETVAAAGVSTVGYGAAYGVGAIGVALGAIQETITTTTSGPGPYPGAVGVGYGGTRGSRLGLGGVGYGAGYGVGVPTVGVSNYGTGYGAGNGYGVGIPAVGGYGAGYRRY